jgi:hypothetical protein
MRGSSAGSRGCGTCPVRVHAAQALRGVQIGPRASMFDAASQSQAVYNCVVALRQASLVSGTWSCNATLVTYLYRYHHSLNDVIDFLGALFQAVAGVLGAITGLLGTILDV